MSDAQTVGQAVGQVTAAPEPKYYFYLAESGPEGELTNLNEAIGRLKAAMEAGSEYGCLEFLRAAPGSEHA